MILNFKEKWMAPVILHGKVVKQEKETGFIKKIVDRTKKHTIRTDKTGRWKAGNIIQIATGSRTPKYTLHAG